MTRQQSRKAAARKQKRHAGRWHPQRDRLLRTWLKWVRVWMERQRMPDNWYPKISVPLVSGSAPAVPLADWKIPEGAKRRLEIVR